MNRQLLAIGLIMGLVPVFLALLNAFDPNKLAQTCVAIGYAPAVYQIASWGNRRPA